MTVFDQLTHALSGSSWAYALIFAVVAGDAVLPLLPGETIVVTGGVLATSGDLNPALVFQPRRPERSSATRPATGSAASSALGRPSGSCAVSAASGRWTGLRTRWTAGGGR